MTETATRPAVDAEPREFDMLIGADWVGARSGERFASVNPFTGRVWATAPAAGAADVDAAVTLAGKALDGPWGAMPAAERGRRIRRLGELIAEQAEELAVLESLDNGKLLREMRGQLKALPGWYEYFGGMADKLEGVTPPDPKPNLLVYTRHEPVGVVGLILPWNSPLLILANKLAPGLAAGCMFVIKPAEQTPASVLAFAKLVARAGIPDGVVNVVTGDGRTGQLLTAHPGVAKVSFTGSTASGIKVMKSAADHVARVTLELGGKSPNIVFDDADLEAAANGVVAGIFAAAGQTCVAGSRLLVHRRVHDELVSRIAARARTIRLGDPFGETTEMGPIAFQEQLDKVASYVDIATAEGASVVTGGKRPDSPELARGFFFEPTILADVDNSMRIAQEEVFGPVLAVIPFDDEESAVTIANDIPFGLGAGIWTDNVRRAHRVAHRVKAGSVWVNEYRLTSYSVPFGGFKQSGIGRENGMDAVREYTETKSVWVNLSDDTRDPFVLG
ncbi:aldehyde dehydrogenase [Amycolatopsis jejuensis]|uniref:aldehyde dehydrogenase n=1 Tax=Amycolatopsis jejuensis TaxID=330084 RepID=UPI000525054D|nr:aldehyde dehydrogenase [Amycolatopsis jejuensis]